jgi:hypothetical protein
MPLRQLKTYLGLTGAFWMTYTNGTQLFPTSRTTGCLPVLALGPNIISY